MATQPPANLPLFYKNLMPLQSGTHANYRARTADKAPFFVGVHAVPLTIDEFVNAQRYFPIVFSVGDTPVPLALMGLNEGVNVFVDDEGALKGEVYVPAYVRRYPWMLARTAPEAQELSLCFDPDSGLIGEFDEGQLLFDGDKPSETTNNVLKFCEDFETSAQRTSAFLAELKALDLIMDGEVTIQLDSEQQPYVYRGFMMVNEEKFRALPDADLRKIHDNGILPLIVAHLFSLSLVRDLFGRQMQQGKVPPQTPPNGAIQTN
jgi:hypothetical protein